MRCHADVLNERMLSLTKIVKQKFVTFDGIDKSVLQRTGGFPPSEFRSMTFEIARLMFRAFQKSPSESSQRNVRQRLPATNQILAARHFVERPANSPLKANGRGLQVRQFEIRISFEDVLYYCCPDSWRMEHRRPESPVLSSAACGVLENHRL
jgi:hypothetical protein